MSEHPNLKVGKVILVAPSLGLGWTENQDFMDFELDKNLVERTAGVIIFVSDDDKQATLDTTKKLEQEVSGIKVRWFHGYGHFIMATMKSPEFPELAEECLKP